LFSQSSLFYIDSSLFLLLFLLFPTAFLRSWFHFQRHWAGLLGRGAFFVLSPNRPWRTFGLFPLTHPSRNGAPQNVLSHVRWSSRPVSYLLSLNASLLFLRPLFTFPPGQELPSHPSTRLRALFFSSRFAPSSSHVYRFPLCRLQHICNTFRKTTHRHLLPSAANTYPPSLLSWSSDRQLFALDQTSQLAFLHWPAAPARRSSLDRD